MSILPELMKEKVLTRTTNPVRANILGLILSEAKSIAKTQGRDVLDSDIVDSAKSLKKKLEKTLPDMQGRPDIYLRTQQEIAELATFLPQTRSRLDTEMMVDGAICTLPLAERKNRKRILELLKPMKGLDMALVNTLISERLK